MKRFFSVVLLFAGLAVSGSGCIIVDDREPDYSYRCYVEGETECGSDWDLDECVHGRWEPLVDCDYECGGYCEDVGTHEAACFCPE